MADKESKVHVGIKVGAVAVAVFALIFSIVVYFVKSKLASDQRTHRLQWMKVTNVEKLICKHIPEDCKYVLSK